MSFDAINALHREVVQVSDLSVPVRLDDDQIAELERQDAEGSVQAAFVCGLALIQRGRQADALPFLRRADEGGHSEAAYLVAQILAAQQDHDGANLAINRAEQRGSMWAPVVLAAMARRSGDREEAARLQTSAVRRARAADSAGAADGAYLLAAMSLLQGDMAGALRLARRADERGSIYAAYVRAQLAVDEGNLLEATEAAERCAAWGMAAPTLLLGDLWCQRRRLCRARRAWRRARAAAERQGDLATRDAASSRLRIRPVRWAWSHPVLTGSVILAAVAVSLMGHVPLVLAAIGWIAVLVVVGDGRRLGERIPVSDNFDAVGAMPALSAGGLTFAGDLVGHDVSPWVLDESTAAPSRVVTDRDRFYLRMLPFLLGMLAAALTAWAAGLFGGVTMLRVLFGWLALATLWHTAFRTPDVLNRTPRDEGEPPTPEGVVIVVRIGLSEFLGVGLRLALTEPRLAEAIELIREKSIQNCPVSRRWRRLSPWLGLVGMLLAAAFFAVEAVAPSQKPLAVIAATVLATAVLGTAALRSIEEVLHGSFRRGWGTVATGAGRLALIGVIVLASYWVGLLSTWMDGWARLL